LTVLCFLNGVHEQLQAVQEGSPLPFHVKHHESTGQSLVLEAVREPSVPQDPQAQNLLEHYHPRAESQPTDGFPYLLRLLFMDTSISSV